MSTDKQIQTPFTPFKATILVLTLGLALILIIGLSGLGVHRPETTTATTQTTPTAATTTTPAQTTPVK
ncbi:MAG: hypothetical protein WCP97_10060 [bacterium]